MFSDSRKANSARKDSEYQIGDNESFIFPINPLLSLFVNTDDPSRKLFICCRKEEIIRNVCKTIANIYYQTFLSDNLTNGQKNGHKDDYYYEKGHNDIVKVDSLAFNGFTLPALQRIGELLENRAVVTAKISIQGRIQPKTSQFRREMEVESEEERPIVKAFPAPSHQQMRPVPVIESDSEELEPKIPSKKVTKAEKKPKTKKKEDKTNDNNITQGVMAKRKRGRPRKDDSTRNGDTIAVPKAKKEAKKAPITKQPKKIVSDSSDEEPVPIKKLKVDFDEDLESPEEIIIKKVPEQKPVKKPLAKKTSIIPKRKVIFEESSSEESWEGNKVPIKPIKNIKPEESKTMSKAPQPAKSIVPPKKKLIIDESSDSELEKPKKAPEVQKENAKPIPSKVIVTEYKRPDDYNESSESKEPSPEKGTEKNALASQPVEKPVEKLVEKPVVKPVEKPADKPVEKPVDKPTIKLNGQEAKPTKAQTSRKQSQIINIDEEDEKLDSKPVNNTVDFENGPTLVTATLEESYNVPKISVLNTKPTTEESPLVQILNMLDSDNEDNKAKKPIENHKNGNQQNSQKPEQKEKVIKTTETVKSNTKIQKKFSIDSDDSSDSVSMTRTKRAQIIQTMSKVNTKPAKPTKPQVKKRADSSDTSSDLGLEKKPKQKAPPRNVNLFQ